MVSRLRSCIHNIHNDQLSVLTSRCLWFFSFNCLISLTFLFETGNGYSWFRRFRISRFILDGSKTIILCIMRVKSFRRLQLFHFLSPSSFIIFSLQLILVFITPSVTNFNTFFVFDLEYKVLPLIWFDIKRANSRLVDTKNFAAERLPYFLRGQPLETKG